ncbi:MAG: phospho-N-acetylmuramoyl-pentapeptide-transferase [Armatimonadetes bacterium]|nr:phospho-N-acetylmuramoyl-pentapeptide-transferase [Armatimonadota bacterium]
MQPDVALWVLPFVVAFVVSIVAGPGVIGMLKHWGAGQTIQEDGPELHKPKAGTPTMGGIVILIGILVGTTAALFAMSKTTLHDLVDFEVSNHVIALLILVLGYAAVGLIDDYLTLKPLSGIRGIASKPKAAIQFLLAVGFVLWLRSIGWEPVLCLGGRQLLLGEAYWALAALFIVGMANFVNITDGLDGLVSGLVPVAAVAFLLCIFLPITSDVYTGNPGLFFVFGPLLVAAAGACVAFLWFNANPAKVFMGDTGSLALGALLPAVAILTHKEILMIVIGLVFVLDGFSTIIQWAVFKYTRITTGTGRRVFKKSPIHHHFEMCGWPEQTVVVRFWICGVIAAALGFAGAAMGWW